jgi:DNA repair protein RecN (Recombination protein N)
MLDWLRVDNLVLIRSATLELGPGLNVISGETGAGKTILAQAVGLLLGGRADDALVGPAGAEAYVEAGFAGVPEDLLSDGLRSLAPEGEDELVLARRVVADGRSRALAWGRSCARTDLEETGGALIDVVSQHAARHLGRPSAQLDLLDGAAAAGELREEMAARWRALVTTGGLLDAARAGAGDRARELEELRLLAQAVEAAELTPGEEDDLRAERDRLRHVDVLYAAGAGAADRLSPEEGLGAVARAGEAARLLEDAATHDPELAALAEEVRAAAGALQETVLGLRGYVDGLEASPGRLEAVESRLGEITDLGRRFGAASAAELVERAAAARETLDRASAGAGEEAALAAALKEAEHEAQATAGRLRSLRQAVAPAFAAAVQEHLADLGMEAAELQVQLAERELGPRGADAVELRLRANPGLPAGSLASTASGGELSRIALAVRLAAHDRDGARTLVFDEVDAGIGGATARALGEKLRGLAADTQVVCITHLPQVAALAERHFRVEKEGAEARIDVLDDDGALAELVRMLGGVPGDEDARALAASLRAR